MDRKDEGMAGSGSFERTVGAAYDIAEQKAREGHSTEARRFAPCLLHNLSNGSLQCLKCS